MRTSIKEYGDDYVAIQFFPENDHEKEAIIAIRNHRANDSQELAAINWVEKALLDESGDEYSVVGFDCVRNNIYYVFDVENENSLGGY